VKTERVIRVDEILEQLLEIVGYERFWQAVDRLYASEPPYYHWLGAEADA
jgi:hypothetical protein